MIYDSQLKTPNVTKRKISINSFLTKGSISSDEMLSNLTDASILFNFDCSDGTLKSGIGLKEYLVNGKSVTFDSGVTPLKLYYYKRFDSLLNQNNDRIVVYGSDKRLYYINVGIDTVFKLISANTFSTPPIAINYNFSDEDVLILSFEKEGLYILNDNTLKKVETAPKISSMCIHSERLFATTSGEGTSIWFSDDFNPTNWSVSLDEAGYIELPDERGKLLKVISFLDYVFVFRSYGISRVYAYGDQTEFSVDNLFNNIGQIYANTVTECGGYVIFLTSSGLYRFNGIDAVKILPFYDRFLNGIENEDAKGVFYNGKLYLSLNMKLNSKVEKVILVYDIDKKVAYLSKGLNADDFELVLGIDYNVYAISNGKICVIDNSGKRFNKPLKKVWESGKTDFSIETSKKKLDKIRITTSEDIILHVIADGKRYIYNVSGGTSILKLNLSGSEFEFKIISYSKMPKILKPSFFFSYVKESLW